MKNRHLFIIVFSLISLVACGSDSLDDTQCQKVFDERSEITEQIEQLQRQYDRGEIDAINYQIQYDLLWEQIFSLEENNPECFF